MSKTTKKKELGFIGRPRIPSTLKAINSMNDGYVPGMAVGFFGEPQCGKTILNTQEAFGDVLGYEEHYGEKKSVLYLDTEGGAEVVLEDWYNIFAERFGIRPKFLFKDIRQLEDIMEFFGYPVKPYISEAGQIFLRPRGVKIEVGKTKQGRIKYEKKVVDPNPPIFSYCQKHNVGTIIIDSITEPLDGYFSGGTPQRPGQAEAVNAWFGRIHWIAKPDLNLPDDEIPRTIVRCILHETVTATNPFKNIPEIKGGHNVRYKFKTAFHMKASTKKDDSHVKRLNIARHSNRKAWDSKWMRYILMTDDGMIDPSKEQARNLYGSTTDTDFTKETIDFSGRKAAAKKKKTSK